MQRKSRIYMSRKKPMYMIIYRCHDCEQESGYTELDRPRCRVCGKLMTTIVTKQKITPEMIATRLKTTTDNMMKNLELAYQELTKMDDKALGEDKDAEGEFLNLLARAKKFRDSVQGLQLKKGAGEDSNDTPPV